MRIGWLVGWKRKLLSKRGRLTLIKSTMVNFPIYYLSTTTIHVNVAKKLETIQCNFLWGDDEETNRFHLLKQDEIKRPLKSMGGWVSDLLLS